MVKGSINGRMVHITKEATMRAKEKDQESFLTVKIQVPAEVSGKMEFSKVRVNTRKEVRSINAYGTKESWSV